MKSIKMYFLLSMIAAFLLTLTSCNKDEVSTENSPIEDLLSRERNDPGKYRNGILTFESLSAAKAQLALLEEAYATAEDQDKFLIETMAMNPGMTLLESKKGPNLELDALIELDPNGFDNYNKNNWFKDEVKMLMLNSDYELGIGRDIIVWYSPDLSYSFPSTDNEMRTIFQTSPKNQSIPPISILSKGLTPIESSASIFMTKGDPVYPPDPNDPDEADPRSFDYFLAFGSNNIDCSVTQKTYNGYVYEVEIDDVNGGILSEVTIPANFYFDFGDNTSAEVLNSESFNILHDYPDVGEYEFSLVAEFIDIEGNIQTVSNEFTQEVNGACSESQKEVSVWKDGSGKAMSGFIRFDKDIFGKKWVAKTIGWRWKASAGKWKKDKGNIKVEGWGIFRNDDCVQTESTHEKDSCGNCKSKRAAKHAGFLQARRDIQRDDIRSYHRASFSNGAVFEENLSLDPCG